MAADGAGLSWARRQERGSAALIRLIIWLARRLGWPIGHALLYPITLYFFMFSGGARAVSRSYLGRVLGRPAGAADVLRHIFVFAGMLLDRVFFLTGEIAAYRIAISGLEHLDAALALKKGCVLLGSHLGSFEVLRACGRQSPVPVRVLMYRENAGAFSRIMAALDPTMADAVIGIGDPAAMLRVRESLQRGEIVGILADRAPSDQKTLAVPFLGDPAPFPTGPLTLAAVLDAPVVLFFGLRTGRRRYEVRFEAFAERVLPAHIRPGRAAREAAIAGRIRQYAGRLETHCRSHPYNWFNFYDFWKARPDAASSGAAGAAVRHGGHPVADGAR